MRDTGDKIVPNQEFQRRRMLRDQKLQEEIAPHAEGRALEIIRLAHAGKNIERSTGGLERFAAMLAWLTVKSNRIDFDMTRKTHIDANKRGYGTNALDGLLGIIPDDKTGWESDISAAHAIAQLIIEKLEEKDLKGVTQATRDAIEAYEKKFLNKNR